MLVSLLPITALAVEASATEASWVFGAAGITPDYTGAAKGTLTDAFTAANANEESTTIYVQLNENVISEENKYFSLQSNKSMVLDLNEKSISSSDSIYCIYTLSGSSLAVKNGTITVNETKNTGYGFFVNGALTVENCTINAEQTSSNSVYGINGRKGSSLTVKNSSITARNTENSGSAYGIYADQGTLTVENCNISAESSNRNAYGISTYYTNASISEGTISAQTNSSSYRAYGVYSSYGSVTLSGTPGISATTADFYYPSTSNYKVVFTGTMSAPSEPYSFIGLSGYGFTSGAYLCNINANNFGDYFVSADPAEEVIYDSGELKLVSKPYVSFYTGSGTPIDRIYLPYSGGMATQPAYPTWEGYTFAGWYADDAYTTEFDFNQTITQNTKVYAKWTFAATGAEVEDSGTLNGTYGSTLDELIEATLSKLSITVTGENGASLGGFSTSNWTVKEGQELAAAQLGDTVTFVGTLTAPTATNYNSDYNYWYGRLPQWEDDLVVEVDVVLDYYVKFGSYTYTTNSDGIMAYTIKTKTFDIIGYFDRNWRSTTYNNGGYETYLKVGDAVNQMNTVTSAGGGDTKLGLNVAIDFAFLNNGQTLQIKYTVNNTTEDAIAFSLGSGADVKIGSDDDALITPFDDGSGYKMVSDDYNDQSAEGDYAQFNFFGKGYAGVTDVTDFWYGGWSSGDATNGCYWTGNKNVAAFYGVAQSESLNDDSAASWHWDDSIGARETKTYSVLIGIGGAGSENAAQGGGLTEPTGSVTIEVSEELTNSNQLVVKLGNITLIEDTDYTVDLSVPDKPVITFNEAAGLNVSSGDLTVTVTFADQGTEDVIITNSIPGTGNISTEEGVLGGVTAEGLDELAKEQNQDIVLTVKEEEKNTEDVEHNAIDTAAGDKTVEFLDITLKDKNSGALITGVLSKVVEIAVPFDDDGKSNVTVYRYHDSAVNTFTMLDSKPADAEIRTDGTFFVDGENNKVYIYTNQFSTYAIGYTMLSTTCTVTFDMNGHGTAIDPATVNSGEKVTKPADPTATGYTFGGWYTSTDGGATLSASAYDFDTPVTDNLTLYAKWTRQVYTIKFVDEDGTELQSGEVAYGETPVYNGSTPTKAATAQYTYTFAGWTPTITAVTGEATYKATYTSTVNEYTVIFADWNGTELDRQTVAYGNAATTPTAPTRTGHTFTGWDKAFDEIVADLTVTAQYRINQYTITFDTNGGSAVDSITQDYNTDVTAPADPTKIGYDFGGWLKDGDDFTFNSYKMGAENFTLIAKWNPANGTAYMVNHHFQNVENDEYTVESETKHGYTDSDTAAEAKSVTGFTAGVVTQKKIAPDGTTVIDIYYTRNVHTLTFKPENGEENIVSEVKFGAAITTPDAPAKTGYTFKGWGEVAATMPDADVSYTAGWTINQYTITFNSNGGSAVTEITQDYNAAVVQPENPTKTGYDFGGWYEDAELTTAYVFSTMPAENITVYAKWNPANGIAYTVKHYHEDVSGDGYTLYETETLRGTTNAQTAAEAKNYPGFTAQTFEQTTILPDGSAVVEIKYDRNIYSVTLVTNGGTVRDGDITEYTYGVGAKLPTDVTRSGYYFGGWYDNEDCKGTPVTEITATDIGDKTFYAKWEYIYIPIITPTYDVEIADGITGGDVSASKKLAYRGDTITITVAPDAGYELTKLTVTDSRGNAVAVTKVTDSKYTFKMPGYDVEIDAVFAKIDTTCPCDWTCPMYGYTDLDRTLWYHDGIHYCIEHGLMVGTGTNIFEPNIATSRAMIVTILWRLEGSPIVNYAMDFEDVAADQWYTEAIRWAASEKIVEGYGNGQFGTNDAITREQMVTIMFRYAKYKGYDVSVGENTKILSYDDAFDVAEWAIPAMQWACGSGMIQGIADGNQMNLAPQGNATRAQAAAILQRYCENVANKD